MTWLDCNSCRKDFHCGKCVCCMPLEKLKKKIRRFPRHSFDNVSMNRVYRAMERIIDKNPTPEDLSLAYIWARVNSRSMARQFSRKSWDGHFRFPRVKHGA